MSPKLEIASANKLILYDNCEEVFFHGSESKEWANIILNYKMPENVILNDSDWNIKKVVDGVESDPEREFEFINLGICDNATFTNLQKELN